jgi:hypothetical protein
MKESNLQLIGLNMYMRLNPIRIAFPVFKKEIKTPICFLHNPYHTGTILLAFCLFVFIFLVYFLNCSTRKEGIATISFL